MWHHIIHKQQSTKMHRPIGFGPWQFHASIVQSLIESLACWISVRIIWHSVILFNAIQLAQLFDDLIIKSSALITIDSCFYNISADPPICQVLGNCFCLLVWHNDYNTKFREGNSHDWNVLLSIFGRGIFVNLCKKDLLSWYLQLIPVLDLDWCTELWDSDTT